MKEILLAGAMLAGVGAPVAAQEAEATEVPPIVEQLDVSPMMETLKESVDFKAEPKFFKQMQRRAENKPDKFFTKKDTGPNQSTWAYSKDGKGTPISVALLESTGFFTGNDYNGVPTGVQFIVEVTDIYLDVGQDGTLADDYDNDLFGYKRMEKITDRYFKEPQVLTDMEWDKTGYRDQTQFTKGSPARVSKVSLVNEEMIEGEPSLSEGWLMTGDQNGFLRLSHYERTIPSLEKGGK